MATTKHIWSQLQQNEANRKVSLQMPHFSDKYAGLRSSSSASHFFSRSNNKNLSFQTKGSNKLDLSFAHLNAKIPSMALQKRQKSSLKYYGKNSTLNMSQNEQLDISLQQRQLESIYLSEQKHLVSPGSITF